ALTISGGIGLDTGRVLEVHAGASWTGGTIQLNPNSTGVAAAGTIRNFAGSIFDINFNGVISANTFGGVDNGAAALFDNQGTFRRSAGSGTTLVTAPFTNTGTVDIQTSTVSFNGVSTHTGATLMGAGTLQF